MYFARLNNKGGSLLIIFHLNISCIFEVDLTKTFIILQTCTLYQWRLNVLIFILFKKRCYPKRILIGRTLFNLSKLDRGAIVGAAAPVFIEACTFAILKVIVTEGGY